MTTLERVFYILCALFLLAVGGCEDVQSSGPAESMDCSEIPYTCEVDWMENGSDHWPGDDQALQPNLSYMGAHLLPDTICVGHVFDDQGTVEHTKYVDTSLQAELICISNWKMCGDSARKYTFYMLGADLTSDIYRWGWGNSVDRWSLVFVGNIRLAFHYYQSRNFMFSNQYASLHEFGHMMGIPANHTEDEYRLQCVMYSPYNPEWMRPPPDFCYQCTMLTKTQYMLDWAPDVECEGRSPRWREWFSTNVWASCSEERQRTKLTLDGLPTAITAGRTHRKADIWELPREIDGLTMKVDVLEDSTLVGEPILVEISLINSGNEVILDPCMLNPESEFLSLYAVQTDTTVLLLEPRARETLVRADFLEIGPGVEVTSLVLLGAKGVVYGGQTRGGSEIPHQYFTSPGRYEVLATYTRVPLGYFDGEGPPLGRIASEVASFEVVEPMGEDKELYDTLGDALSDLMKWKEMKGLYLEDPDSPYAPYMMAKYANGLALTGKRVGAGGDFATTVLEDLIRLYPHHRLSEDMGFDIVTHMIYEGEVAEGRKRLDALLEKYPSNVRAYEVPGPDGFLRTRADRRVKPRAGE